MIRAIGQVIRIPDKYTVIINAGIGKVNVGDVLQIYELTDEIKDLDGTILDPFVYVKGEIEVVQVESSYSVCKSNKTYTKKTSPLLALSPSLEPREITARSPLNIEADQLEPFNELKKKICIGDNVKAITQ